MELEQLIVRFEAMSEPVMNEIIRKEMVKAIRPFAPLVRAAILNTPSKGTVPYHQPPGLRLRIARCVEAWVEVKGPIINGGVEVNAARMPSGQKALPLYLEGAKAPWRHPVFGDRSNWVTQAAHPYFWDAVNPMLPATKKAIERATERIAQILEGA